MALLLTTLCFQCNIGMNVPCTMYVISMLYLSMSQSNSFLKCNSRFTALFVQAGVVNVSLKLFTISNAYKTKQSLACIMNFRVFTCPFFSQFYTFQINLQSMCSVNMTIKQLRDVLFMFYSFICSIRYAQTYFSINMYYSLIHIKYIQL